MTEVDGMDEARGKSREADPVEQFIARIKAYGELARIYMECTVSIDRGRIWQEYQAGSASRIVLLCPCCAHWVTPEREHLTGWEDAEDQLTAMERAHLICADCQAPWTEQQRVHANQHARLLHKGQEITADGVIVGPRPRTRTLGFRWTAANNMLAPISLVGGEEWAAAHAINHDNANKKMQQFVWAIPHEPDDREVVALSIDAVTKRQSHTPQGLVPAWADCLTMGVDCGQYLLHWVLLAGDVVRSRHVQIVDYGVEEVHSRQYRVEEALSMALGSLAGRAEDDGWPDERGEAKHPDLIWYDSGWKPVPVYRHCKKHGPRHWPAKGFGLGQYTGPRYHQPKTTGATTVAIFDGFHLSKIKNNDVGPVQLYEHDADRAKARVHDRLGTPEDEAGALLLPQVNRAVEHISFAKHLLAEQLVEEDGLQKWQKTPGHAGQNHWLDATALALLALLRRVNAPKPAPRPQRRPVLTAPDGRPFLVTQR
jgi:phage terminase large subunit GpA-like protein